LMFMKRHCVFADSWSANWTRKCEEDNWFYWGIIWSLTLLIFQIHIIHLVSSSSSTFAN
jgi:hypothetical protein